MRSRGWRRRRRRTERPTDSADFFSESEAAKTKTGSLSLTWRSRYSDDMRTVRLHFTTSTELSASGPDTVQRSDAGSRRMGQGAKT